jgi:oleate hydratase
MAFDQNKLSHQAQCWLVGAGVGCLAAAVHLIEEGVSGQNIHLIDISSAQDVQAVGNAVEGYTIHHGIQPYFHDSCVEDFLSIIPDASNRERSLYDKVADDIRRTHQLPKASVRLLLENKNRLEGINIERLHMRLQDRLHLVQLMVGSEDSLGDKAIRQVFDTEFFSSRFWILWSTSFAIQPWHSAAEFRRHLCKYLPKIHDLNDSGIFGRVQYSIFDSILRPTLKYLEEKGVQCLRQARLKAILTDISDDDNNLLVTSINLQSAQGAEICFSVRPDDIVIASLDPVISEATLGSNASAPGHLDKLFEDSMNQTWSLWHELSRKIPNLGKLSNFSARLGESKLVTFTVTLKSSTFLRLYTELTQNQPGSGAFVTLADSNWCLTINIPEQPVFYDQPDDVDVFWGYGLNFHADGNFIEKPMYECSGKEIMTELLSHLKFPLDGVLDTSTTIPSLAPYATSAMLTRNVGDRPEINPKGTSNFAVVGQFVDIPNEPTFSMDYSVRSAQIAVHSLLGTKEPLKSKRNSLLAAFDLLA